MHQAVSHWTTPFLRRPGNLAQATPLRSVEPGDSRKSVEKKASYFPEQTNL